MPSTTHNGETFEVGSWPHPTYSATARMTTGSCQLIYTAASPYETKLVDFDKAIIGWSRINPSFTDRLNRYFPFGWPLRTQGSLSVLQLSLTNEGRGTENGTTTSPTVNPPSPDNYWPTCPLNIYKADFGPLPYSRFDDDTTAYAGPSPPRELGRFIKVYEQPVPREYRRPDYGFVTDEATPQEVLQVGFVPFIQAEVTYTWFQVPYPDAVPWNTIQSTYLKVNNADFDGDELALGYPAGTLLFTRVDAPDDWYYGPGGVKYVDLKYCFIYNPFGWNTYLRPNGTTVSLKRKNVTPSTPPYQSATYTQLFNPGAG